MIEQRSFGSQFQEILDRNGLSHKKAAEILEVPRPTLISWTHNVVPGSERMGRILETFEDDLTEEEIEIMANSLQARLDPPLYRHTPEQKAKISEALTRKFEDPEYRKRNAEHLARVKGINTGGYKHSLETRARMSAAKKNAFLDPEKYAQAVLHLKSNRPKPRIGWKHSDEAKRKMSETQTGRFVSDETRRRVSEAKKLYWQNKRQQTTT